MSQQRFPPGWDEQRVREVLAHYENQGEDEQFAEIEAAGEAVEHKTALPRVVGRASNLSRRE